MHGLLKEVWVVVGENGEKRKMKGREKEKNVTDAQFYLLSFLINTFFLVAITGKFVSILEEMLYKVFVFHTIFKIRRM